VTTLPFHAPWSPYFSAINLAFNDIEPFVFAFVVMRPRSATRRSDIEKGRELAASLFAVKQHDYCVAKRTQRATFVGSHQERTAQR
jgi:hypothetical protein